MDFRSREAALKRRNDELDACQILCGEDNPTASYMQDQTFDSPLLSRQDCQQDCLPIVHANLPIEQNTTEDTPKVN